MKKLYLIDGNALIYRMFFALPEFTTSNWKVVNALFWVAKFFTSQMVSENPDYLIFVRDAKWDNFRHQLYAEYKATRDRMPDSLRTQVDEINTMVEKMGFKVIEESGYEADDVIATLVKKYKDEYEVYVLSGDKDLFVLIDDHVKIYDTIKKKIYGREEAKEKFEIESKYVTDYLALVWDTSDNIPGISWIGPKKVIPLINTFWSVESIFEVVWKVVSWEVVEMPDEIKKILSGKTLEKIWQWKEMAFLSKKLATLDSHIALRDFQMDEYLFHTDKLETPEVKDFFRENEFFSLVSAWEKKTLKKWDDLWLKVQIIWDSEWLSDLEKKIDKYTTVTFDTETTSIDAIKADLVWVSLYLDDDNIYYINVLHSWPKVEVSELQAFLKWLFEKDITIVGHNLKYDLIVIDRFLKDSHTKSEKSQHQWVLF